jgi:hypothetical protein
MSKYYTYKITFEDLPGYFYYGKHKDNGKPYFGSPKTWKRLWKHFKPQIQILQWYETEESVDAAETSVILATWEDKYSLNESVGPRVSEDICRQNGLRTWEENAAKMNDHPNTAKARVENGKKRGPEMVKKIPLEKKIEGGKKGGEESHRKGKGAHGMSKEEKRNLAIENIAGHNKKGVKCVETGTSFSSCVEAAASSPGSNAASIRRACRENRKSGGYHWQFTVPTVGYNEVEQREQ